MIVLKQLLSAIAMVSLVLSSVPMRAHAAKGELNERTRDALAAMKEGRENETLAEYFNRMAKYLPEEVSMDMSAYLKDKGHLTAPKIDVNDGEIVYTQSGRKLTVKIEPDGNVNRVTVNGRVMTKKDFSTMKNYMDRLEKIVREDFGGGGSKKATKQQSRLFMPFALMISEAHAETNWMAILLGGAIGGAVGYFAGPMLGLSPMMGGVIGAGIGALAGWYFFSGDKCPAKGSQECCNVGGTTSMVDCCAKSKGTLVTVPSGGVCGQIQDQPRPASGVGGVPTGTR